MVELLLRVFSQCLMNTTIHGYVQSDLELKCTLCLFPPSIYFSIWSKVFLSYVDDEITVRPSPGCVYLFSESLFIFILNDFKSWELAGSFD